MERFITFETPTAQGTSKAKGLRTATANWRTFHEKKDEKKKQSSKRIGILKIKDVKWWISMISLHWKFFEVHSSFDSSSRAISFSFNFGGALNTAEKSRFQKFFSAWLPAEVSPKGRSPKKEIIIQLKTSVFWPQKMEKKTPSIWFLEDGHQTILKSTCAEDFAPRFASKQRT